MARTVRSPIETLDLGEERFDAVVLGSFLVHTSDHRVGEGLLGTCRGHVKGDRVVLIQREGADYRVDLPRERGDREAGCTIRILSADPVGDGVDEARVEYVFEDVRWTQTFRSRALSVEQFEGYPDEAGLVVDRHLTPDACGCGRRPLPHPGRRLGAGPPRAAMKERRIGAGEPMSSGVRCGLTL